MTVTVLIFGKIVLLETFVKNSCTECNGNRRTVWSLLEVTEKRAD